MNKRVELGKLLSQKSGRELTKMFQTELAGNPLEFNRLLNPNKQATIDIILQSLNDKQIETMLQAIIEELEDANTAPVSVKHSVFIVHGHDEEAKAKAEAFVRKFGLQPIILREQADKGLSIIEKFEEYSDVDFAIVLYTPCDEGKDSKSNTLQPRARQNVVFEHGYFVAKLGRKNVCVLKKGDIEKPGVETPGDIAGVIYVDMDSNDWELKLARNMQVVFGDKTIDFNKL